MADSAEFSKAAVTHPCQSVENVGSTQATWSNVASFVQGSRVLFVWFVVTPRLRGVALAGLAWLRHLAEVLSQ